MRAAFGEALRSPWEELRGALVLGGAKFLARVGALLEPRRGQEEIKWRQREVETVARHRRALELV